MHSEVKDSEGGPGALCVCCFWRISIPTTLASGRFLILKTDGRFFILKDMKTQKYIFFLYYVKSGVENEFEFCFVQFDLFKEKIGHYCATQIP